MQNISIFLSIFFGIILANVTLWYLRKNEINKANREAQKQWHEFKQSMKHNKPEARA